MTSSGPTRAADGVSLTTRPGGLWFVLWVFLDLNAVRQAAAFLLGPDTGGVQVFGWFTVGCAVVVTLLTVVLIGAGLSTSTTLVGTTLVVRGFSPRTVDLATAQVSLTARNALSVVDSTGRKALPVPLVPPLRGALPADQLTALAAVLPPPVADQVLELATDPETRRRASRLTRRGRAVLWVLAAVAGVTYLVECVVWLVG